MAEMTIDGKQIVDKLTLSIRLPRAFGLRNWLTLRLLAVAGWVSPVPLEVGLLDDAAEDIQTLGHLQRMDNKPGDRFVLTMDRPISMEMRDRIHGIWRQFIGGDEERHRLLVLDGGAKIGAINGNADDAQRG